MGTPRNSMVVGGDERFTNRDVGGGPGGAAAAELPVEADVASPRGRLLGFTALIITRIELISNACAFLLPA